MYSKSPENLIKNMYQFFFFIFWLDSNCLKNSPFFSSKKRKCRIKILPKDFFDKNFYFLLFTFAEDFLLHSESEIKIDFLQKTG